MRDFEGQMRSGWRAGILLLALGLVLPLDSFAQAQPSAKAKGDANSGANIDLQLTGELTSAIQIVVTGSIDLNGNETTLVSGSGSSGVVNFGTYDLTNQPLLTGSKHRVMGQLNSRGTYLVATVNARVWFSGFTSADIDLTRSSGGALDLPDGHVLFAFMGKRNAKARNQKLSWPRWKDFPETRLGTTIFEVPSSGTERLDEAMSSGDGLDHQLAVWIPDTQPPGPFATIITYIATAH